MTDLKATAKALEVPVRVCDGCEDQYVDWWADEPLWDRIVGSYEGSLCLDCFRLRCWQDGIATAVIGYDAKGQRVTETGAKVTDASKRNIKSFQQRPCESMTAERTES